MPASIAAKTYLTFSFYALLAEHKSFVKPILRVQRNTDQIRHLKQTSRRSDETRSEQAPFVYLLCSFFSAPFLYSYEISAPRLKTLLLLIE